jgi:hypothetical protein
MAASKEVKATRAAEATVTIDQKTLHFGEQRQSAPTRLHSSGVRGLPIY